VGGGDGLQVVASGWGPKGEHSPASDRAGGVTGDGLQPDVSAEAILRTIGGFVCFERAGTGGVLDYAVEAIQGTMGNGADLWDCLGHQLLGRAIGAEGESIR